MSAALDLHTVPEEELEPRPRRTAADLLSDRISANESSVDVQSRSTSPNTLSDPTIEEVLEVQDSDLEGLEPVLTSSELQADNPTQLRTSHHAMALAMATGSDNIDISRMFGVSVQTLELLEKAPAFIELVEAYKEKDPEKVSFSLQTKMEALAHDALDEQRRRLDALPGQFTPTALRELAGDLLDRTGHGKVSKSMSLLGGLDGAEIERIKKEEPQLIGSSTLGNANGRPAAD